MTRNFDFNEANRIYNDNKRASEDYIAETIIPLFPSGHAVRRGGKWTMLQTIELRETIFGRLPKELSRFYFKDHRQVRTIVYEIGKPELYDDKLNLCPAFKFQPSEKPLTKEVKRGLKVLKEYMLNTLCSGEESCYDFLMQWLGNMARGNKNNSCLYLKGCQGSGKSTLFHFLSNFVLGSDLCLETGSDPIRTKFNEILGGKILVSIEELENFSKSEWESISSTLKRMITSDTIVLQNKCTKAVETKNPNNYILCSNNDAIKDDDGRRYFILDISVEHIGDHAYYQNLYENVMNDQVGEAFFNVLINVDLTDYNPQVFPLTKSKIDSINMRLDSVSRFIKEEYVLCRRGINMSCASLYQEFVYFNRNSKCMSAIAFHRKMSELQFVRKRRDTTNYYIATAEFIQEIADSKHWLTELDEFKDHDPIGPNIRNNLKSYCRTVDDEEK